jgi:hypothetical protein
MTWLLKLYPPRWRRLYGEEFRALIGRQPFSIAAVADVIAGAVDAWTDPQTIPLTRTEAAAEKGEAMTVKTMKLRCAGYGPGVTKDDRRKSEAIMIGGSLLLTVIWLWLHIRLGDNPYVDSFSMMLFLAPYVASMRYTSLKGRSGRTQAICIAGTILVMTLIFGLTGWITTRI